MQKPTVDILMPTFEPNPEHLLQAIDSILAQTEQHWRLFIHDDASTTDVHSIVASYLHDSRITFSRSSERRGIGGNWNSCIHLANAPYIQFLFQDDIWTPLYLERTLNIMSNELNISLLSVHHTYTCENNIETAPHYQYVLQKRQEILHPGKQNARAFLLGWLHQGLVPNLIGEPSFVMLRRELVEQVGDFREDLKQFLDVEYWVRCLKHGNWYHLDEELGTFRVHIHGASFQNFQSGTGLTERTRCLWEIYKTSPKRSEERRIIRASLQTYFARIVEQSLKRGMRACRKVLSA